MINKEKRLLIKQAVELRILDILLEHKWRRLNRLVKCGVPCSAPEMIEAYASYNKYSNKWIHLKAKHLTLRIKLESLKNKTNHPQLR